jgi:hypothetical protein
MDDALLSRFSSPIEYTTDFSIAVKYLGVPTDVDASAVLVELTGQDVSRLQRSVLTSAVYPLQDLLSATADDMWAEEE